MKPIEINSKKLHDYIVAKDELVTEGRKITGEIEKTEKKIKAYEDREKRITGKIEPDAELVREGEVLVKTFNETLERLDAIADLIEKEKLAAVPKDIEEAHKAEMKKKEEMERDRNKVALKIQKIKDRIVPLIQKECKPLLAEFDDIETAQARGGKVFVTTFNHLADWKRKFKARQG